MKNLTRRLLQICLELKPYENCKLYHSVRDITGFKHLDETTRTRWDTKNTMYEGLFKQWPFACASNIKTVL